MRGGAGVAGPAAGLARRERNMSEAPEWQIVVLRSSGPKGAARKGLLRCSAPFPGRRTGRGGAGRQAR